MVIGGALSYVFSNAKKVADYIDDINTSYDVINEIQFRNPKSYTNDTLEYIHLITIDPDAIPVGSQKFKVHKYPGDIDMFEKIEECCTLKDARFNIASRMRQIGRNIKSTPNVFLGDCKAGLDDRYFIDLGSWNKENKLENYHPIRIRNKLHMLHYEGLLNDNEHAHLIKHVIFSPTKRKWDSLNDELRKFYILRWSLNELIRGFKIIKGKVFRLEDAITHPSVVKLDLYAPMNDRYNEITNFLVLTYKDTQGNIHPINITLKDRTETLVDDIIKYSSDEYRDNLKYAKRLWVLSVLKQNKSIYEKLNPLFSGDISLLNQICSEIEVIISILTRIPDPPMNIILKQIDEFKSRVNSIIDVNISETRFYNLIDTMIQIYNDTGNKSDLTGPLQLIYDHFKRIIEVDTEIYLKKHKLLNVKRILVILSK